MSKICELCGRSNPKPQNRFCSALCRNTHNGRLKKMVKGVKCPICGHVGYGRRSEFCSEHNPDRVIWIDTEIELIKTYYPSKGPVWLSERMPHHRDYIRDKAYEFGLTLDPDVYRKLVHNRASEWMTSNNPSQIPGATERLREQATKTNAVQYLIQGHRDMELESPNKLEQELFSILDELGINYERQVIVGTKICDIRIGKLIIEADGDYWHGHPRYEPLTKRQETQRRSDVAKDRFLRFKGYIPIRIWESDMSKSTVNDVLVQNGILDF